MTDSKKLIEVVGPAGRIMVTEAAFKSDYESKGYKPWKPNPPKPKAKKEAEKKGD